MALRCFGSKFWSKRGANIETLGRYVTLALICESDNLVFGFVSRLITAKTKAAILFAWEL